MSTPPNAPPASGTTGACSQCSALSASLKQISSIVKDLPVEEILRRHPACLACINNLTADIETAKQPKLPQVSLTDSIFPHSSTHNLLCGILENGFQYVVLKNDLPGKRFHAHLQVGTGSTSEDEHERGIAHYVEHCMFTGCQRYPNNQFLLHILGHLGMSLGSDTNAFTQYRQTVYTFSSPCGQTDLRKLFSAISTDENEMKYIPEGEVDNVEIVIDMLDQMVFHTTFNDIHKLETERFAVLSEKALRDKMGYELFKSELQSVLKGSLINNRHPIGLESTIRGWKLPEDVQKFWEKWYYPGNMTLYVVGDIDPPTVVNFIRHIFGREKPRYAVMRRLPPFSEEKHNFNDLVRNADLPEYSYPTWVNGRWITPQLATSLLDSPEVLNFDDLPRPPTEPQLKNDILEVPEEPFIEFRHPSQSLLEVNLVHKLPLGGYRSFGGVVLDYLNTFTTIILEKRVSRLVHSEQGKSGKYPLKKVAWRCSQDIEIYTKTCELEVVVLPSGWQEGLEIGLKCVRQLYDEGSSSEEFLFIMDVMDGAMKGKSSTTEPSRSVVESLLNYSRSYSAYISAQDEAKLWTLIKANNWITRESLNARIKVMFEPFIRFGHQKSIATCMLVRPLFFEFDPTVDKEFEHTYTEAQPNQLSLFDKSFVLPGAPKAEKESVRVVSWLFGRKSEKKGTLAPYAAHTLHPKTQHPQFVTYNRREFSVKSDEIVKTIITVLGKPAADPVPVPVIPVLKLQYTQATESPKYTSSTVDVELQICSLTMNNGIKVSYKLIDGGSEECRLSMILYGGWVHVKRPEDNPQLALSCLVESGPSTLGSFESSLYADINQLSVSYGVGSNYFSIDISTDGAINSIRTALEYLKSFYVNGKLERSVLQKLKESTMLETESSARSIESASMKQLIKSIFQDDVRFVSPSLEAINSVTIDACRELIKESLCTRTTQILAVGVFNHEKFEQACLDSFGSLPMTDRPVLNNNPGFPFLRRKGTTLLKSLKNSPRPILEQLRKSAKDPTAPLIVQSISGEIPLLSLAGLNVVSCVVLHGDTPRAQINIAMPYCNSRGHQRVQGGAVCSLHDCHYKASGSDSHSALQAAQSAATAFVQVAATKHVQQEEENSHQLQKIKKHVQQQQQHHAEAGPLPSEYGYKPAPAAAAAKTGAINWNFLSLRRTEAVQEDLRRTHPLFPMLCSKIFESMVSDRLMAIIRGNLGLCYTVQFGVTMPTLHDSGMCSVSCSVFADERILRLTTLCIIDVLQMPLGSFTETEFMSSKLPLSQSVMQGEGSASVWIKRLTECGLPSSPIHLTDYLDLGRILSAITLQDVKEVASHFFVSSNENLYISLGMSTGNAESRNTGHLTSSS